MLAPKVIHRPTRRHDVLGEAGRDLVAGESLCTDAAYSSHVFHPNGVRSTTDMMKWKCPDCGYDSTDAFATT